MLNAYMSKLLTRKNDDTGVYVKLIDPEAWATDT